jgi:hypothetical protein
MAIENNVNGTAVPEPLKGRKRRIGVMTSGKSSLSPQTKFSLTPT